MGDTTSSSSASSELRILTRLGLERLAIADQLVLVLKRFRAAQLRDLDDTLHALPDHGIVHIQNYFDRTLDVKDELERYAQDLLKTTHLMRHLQIDGDAQREIETLMVPLGDAHDRVLLLKMLQSLGARLARVLCGFCLQLSHLKLQQEFYRVFATAESGMSDLKQWMQWLDCCRPKLDVVTVFLTKCTMERCLAQWLKLLSPLTSQTRVMLIERLANADATLLKQIGRFHDVTGLSIAKLLDLCNNFRAELSMLLNEFPMATTLTLYAKFNDDRLIDTVIKALHLLGKGEVVRLVDALATEDNLRAIHVFFISMMDYERRSAVASLYLSLSKPTQSRLLHATMQIAADPSDHEDDTVDRDSDLLIVFDFLLDGHLQSMDEVLRKLSLMSKNKVTLLMKAMRNYTEDERVLLGEGIEAIHDVHCLDVVFRLFDLLVPAQRPLLIDWVHDMPGVEALQLYDKLLQLHANSHLDKVENLLHMMASLNTSDKIILCSRLLRPLSNEDEAECIDHTNDGILKYLCDCDSSRRHKTVKLLDATDCASYDTLLFLLRTQRMPEQVALTKVMLSLSHDANGRLLSKLQGLDGDTLDEFFQLLMLIPKVEYKMLSRLLVSLEVSPHHFEALVHVAANMMNQAATREIVIFAAELPPQYRNMFFEILTQCTPAEKGVVMRIVACSTRLSPEMLQLFVELLLRMPWETRSALVEQLRALEESVHIQKYVLVLREFDDDACLPRMVHLLVLLALPVRISLVLLFAQMNSRPERVQALAKLSDMRKDLMPPYCLAVCDPFCLHMISCNYLRVFGYLQDEYQPGMLKLLQWKSCWVFIEVLAATINVATARADASEDGASANSALVNGLAASLTMLDHEGDYTLLGNVMEEAMGNGIRLEELIVVLAHFRERERLLVLLKYVAHLARYARSTLFFRVLSRSQATAFLFDMCHVLDLDDALFALKRLDRMWSRDANTTDSMLTTMARKGAAVDLRDEFCNLILGYRERTPQQRATRKRVVDRVIAPRHDECNEQENNSRSQSSENGLVDDEYSVVDLSSVAPTSLRPIPITKQLERVQDKREDARRRRRCRNWREWTQSDWEDVLRKTEKTSIEKESWSPSQNSGMDQVIGAASIPSSSDLSGDPPNTCSMKNEKPVVCESADIASEATLVAEDLHQPFGIVLPPITRQLPPIEASTRPSGHNDRLTLTPTLTDQVPGSSRGLARSESAPATLIQSDMSRSKRCRGLQAALGLDDANAHHPPRDQGANIFHSQCEQVIAHGLSRIRVAHTESAHARILAARADHVLGRRSILSSSSASSKSSLERRARHTIERATLALVHGEKTRSQGARDFVKWIHKSESA